MNNCDTTRPKPLAILSAKDAASWDEWLEITEHSLKEMGYKKFNQKLSEEDFAYWKVFKANGQALYQVGVFFYDFRNNSRALKIPERIGVQFKCMFCDIDDRIEMTVSKNIILEEFEKMSYDFYTGMSPYAK